MNDVLAASNKHTVFMYSLHKIYRMKRPPAEPDCYIGANKGIYKIYYGTID